MLLPKSSCVGSSSSSRLATFALHAPDRRLRPPQPSGSPLDELAAPDMLCMSESPLKDASFQLFRHFVRTHQPRSGQSARQMCSHGRSPASRLHGRPINPAPHHDIADPRTHTFPDTARRDALYEPTNLTNLLRHHEHSRAEGGRERNRGGEEGQAGAAEVGFLRRAIR